MAAGAPARPRRTLDFGDWVAAVVVAGSSRDPDLAPFVGGAHLGESLLIWPRDAEPRLAFLTAMEREEAAGTGLALLEPAELGVRELLESRGEGAGVLAGVLERALERAGVAPGLVGVGGHAAAGDLVEACGALAAGGWSFVSARGALRRLRKRKTAEELEDARRAAAGAREAFLQIARVLAGGFVAEGRPLADAEGPVTAGRLRARAAAVFARHGLDQPEGNIVAAGREAGIPHSRGASERTIRAGEALVVDLFPRRRLFADCTRTFCVGRPPEGLAEAAAEVEGALAEARGAALPGVAGQELQQLVCERFRAAGHPTPLSHPGTESGYVHGVGHGVGFELHELPSFRVQTGPAGLLEVADLVTLEPGLYYPERGWGVRLENLYEVRQEGVVSLTPLPCDLDPRRWE